MFDFKGVTHVIENPRGHAPGWNYSLVGHVPTSLLERRPPTSADVMAGRVQADGFTYHARKWETIAELVAAARAAGVSLCASPTCACRHLFPADPATYTGRLDRQLIGCAPAGNYHVCADCDASFTRAQCVDGKMPQHTFNRTPCPGSGVQLRAERSRARARRAPGTDAYRRWLERHRAADPHCTCNDCIGYEQENQQ